MKIKRTLKIRFCHLLNFSSHFLSRPSLSPLPPHHHQGVEACSSRHSVGDRREAEDGHGCWGGRAEVAHTRGNPPECSQDVPQQKYYTPPKNFPTTFLRHFPYLSLVWLTFEVKMPPKSQNPPIGQTWIFHHATFFKSRNFFQKIAERVILRRFWKMMVRLKGLL